MSFQYTLQGEIEEIQDTYQGYPIFRKFVNPLRFKNELEIAKKLMQQPCPHCVRIYDIQERGTYTYIDMEFLHTPPPGGCEKEKILTDTRLALEELHLQQVVYIDLKEDNIGFSERDQVWKLFDFDASGIADSSFTAWTEPPPYYYAYKFALKEYHHLECGIDYFPVDTYSLPNLLLFDTIVYKHFLQTFQ